MPRLLVTGAAGFVGTALAAALGGRADLIALTGDIRDGDAVARQLRRAQPDAVIHLAAIAAPAEAARAPEAAWAVNVMGTLNLARAVLAEAPAARLVFAGSSEAYGESAAAGTPLTEAAPLRPRTPYGATKAAAELMLAQMAHEGLRAVRFRPFNHTGPDQDPRYVIPAFARQIVRIEHGRQPPLLRTGNLAVARDFLDVGDVVAAYLLAALEAGPEIEGEVYNLASGTAVPLRELLERLLAMSERPIAVETDPARLRKDEIAVISGDAGKAARELGWRPRIALADTLAGVLARWRQRAAADPAALDEA